jgi:hypothetical protein
MKKSLDRLPTRADGDCVNVIVESPRGSRLKFDFDPKLGTFTVGRPLPLGMSYPFDWGFIPSTRGADGDPVDAMILNDVPTYPAFWCGAGRSAWSSWCNANQEQSGAQQPHRALAAVARRAPRGSVRLAR